MSGAPKDLQIVISGGPLHYFVNVLPHEPETAKRFDRDDGIPYASARFWARGIQILLKCDIVDQSDQARPFGARTPPPEKRARA